MGFPITARYKLRFRNSDTGLSPVFVRFQKLTTFEAIEPSPAIIEVGGGDYYFEWTWTTVDDPDIDFAVDGGPSIPVEEVRYISDIISVRDYVVAATGGSSGGSSVGGGQFSVG